MAKAKAKTKSKITVPSIREIVPLLKKPPLPVYYFFGEDQFAIEKVVELIQKTYADLISSDFDKEIIHCEKSTRPEQILQAASSFPFGGGKKLVIVKQFDLIKDKTQFTDYIKSPQDSTILILLDNRKSFGLSKEPYKTLTAKGYIFEARQLKGAEWYAWVKSRARELKISIDDENAQRLLEIVGTEKQLLMRQLEKFRDYLGEGGTVTKEIVLKLASPTKTYTTFELQDAYLRGDRKLTLKIGFHLLDNGIELYEILPLLSSAVTILMQRMELKNKNFSTKNEEAKAAGVHPYYYNKIISSPYFRNISKVRAAAKALLEADLLNKTSGGNAKNIFLQLVSKTFPGTN